MRRLRRILLSLAALGLAAAMAAHWAVRMDSYRGFAAPVIVEIPLGTSTMQIGELLAEAGVLRHPWLFAMARLTRPAAKPQAGEYEFTRAATPAEVFARIARGDVYLVEMAVPEGSNAFDVAGIIARQGFGGETEALRLALPHEGYLFPAVYKFKRRATVKEVVEAMRRRGDQAWRELGAHDAKRREITVLASLVEKEAAVAAERGLIAGVYANRLQKGMRLECDPTVEYAARLAGRWRGTIYKSDLAFDHPYNTYQRSGLPPGPIANPGMASLKAALSPAETAALFFVARPDGSGAHVFSETLDAHARAVAQYRKGLKDDAGEARKPGRQGAPVVKKPRRATHRSRIGE